MPKKAKVVTRAKATAPVDSADWLGKATGDEDKLIADDSDVEDEPAEEGEESEAADDDEDGEVDDSGEVSTSASAKTLARITEGEDLNAIKQAIQDDAALLGNWRKAKKLGDVSSREEVFLRLVGNCSKYYGYSEELADYFLRMFSAEQAVQFFEANEQHRPMTIRTNSLKANRNTLMASLTARKVHVDPVGPWTKVGLKVYESAVPIGATPEYLGGQYMIQSASSFVPCMALAPQQNETVLDMAAAPGGKTTYLGQLMRNTGTLFANDLKAERCKSLVANVHRLGLTNVIATNLDGKKLEGMLPKLDRVLLDAPCSGSGIIARDPSVKVKRGQKDFDSHSKLQKELLMAAIDMVDANSKTGGYIVYSTCSVAVEEDEAVIDHALRVRNVELVPFTSAVNFGVEGFTKYRSYRFHPSMNHCRRYLPHIHNMDGFFVAKLKKTSNTIPERVKKDRSKMDETIGVPTKDMMDSVVDFEAAKAPKDAGKPKNKIERKRIKRNLELAAREAAKAKAGEASPKKTAEDVQGEPKAAAGKKKLKQRPAEEAAPAERKVLNKKKRAREENEAQGGAPAKSEETTPQPATRTLKKKRKSV